MDISIKKAGKKDLGTLAEIHSVSLIAAFGEIFPEELVLARFGMERRLRGFRKELESGSPTNILVYDGNDPVGLMTYGPSRYCEVDDKSIELWRIYFLPGYWGKGAAGVALGLVLRDLEKLGFKKCFLWVLEENLRAQRFYIKNGFRQTRRVLNAEFGRPIRDFMYEIDLVNISKSK